MKLSFDNDIALVFMLIFALLAIAVSMIAYYKNRKTTGLSVVQTRFLFLLRASAVFLCLFLFLKPVIILKKQIKEKPVIIIAADNSQSLKKYGAYLIETVEKIKKGLPDKYEPEFWLFGENATTGSTLDFSDNQSDYSELLASVSNRYLNKNVGALVLFGDGIYNAGQNPLNYAEKLVFPVYAVGFGDTASVPDIRISDVKHNKSVFTNNYFSVEADIHFEKLAGRTVQIELSHDKKNIGSRTIIIPSNLYFTTETFSIQAAGKGLQSYKITVVTTEQENNTANNSHEFVVEVTDTKNKVLVFSDGPHPDIGTMKETLEGFSNFDLTLANGNTFPGNPEEFDLFVLYQLPSSANFNAQALQSIINSKKPLLFVVGAATNLPYLNNLQMGIRSMPANGLNECQISINRDFPLFRFENGYAENLEMFPPVYVPYTEFRTEGNFQALAYQKIKGIITIHPLVVLGSHNERKIGYILGEGIWRWRMYDYHMDRQHKTIDEFLCKIFNYLVLKENDENFKLVYSTVYSENEDIAIGAELYNDSYEAVNSPDVSLVLQKDSATEFHYIFDKTGNRYSLNIGKPGPGIYRMEANVSLGNRQFSKNGSFRVIRVNYEDQQTVANHQFLYQLAHESGGQFFQPEQYDKLLSEIKSDETIKPDKFVHFNQNELLNSKWLFMLTVLIFSMEWFLRKYWGIY
ncbi:MAG: hypothetical protein RBS73_10990 [Prolixibacteraceae bacterium]|nr:hypothetical protein [Prolixibacteraceae bacterium]